MSRVWMPIVLLLSLGVNLGLLAAVAAGRWQEGGEPARAVQADSGAPLVPDAATAGSKGEVPGAGAEDLDLPVPPPNEGGTAPEPEPAGPASPEDGSGDGPASSERPTHGERGAAGAAEPEGGDTPGGAPLLPGAPVERLADHLGLSGERRERFVALQRELVATHLRARQERRRLTLELRRELVAAEPDPARLEAITAALGRLLTASERRSARLILASRELLPPDQQRAYLHFLERLRTGPGGGPGAGGAGGRPRPFQRHRPRP